MKITATNDFTNLETLEDVKRYASIAVGQIKDALNGLLTFQDNFQSQIVSVSFASVNTDVQISHSLGRVPTGYLHIRSTAAMVLYDGASANTDALLYIRSNGVGTATVLIF